LRSANLSNYVKVTSGPTVSMQVKHCLRSHVD